MGRSTASCLKILACGSGSVDNDDLRTTEGKSSGDRQCWNFRKRSARNRILSNSATAETLSPVVHKESLESTAVDFQVRSDLIIPEKASAIHLTEVKPELSAQPDTKLSEPIVDNEDDDGAGVTLDEPSAIVIQTGIRGSMARQELSNLKYIIKVQAVARGHLVRRQAAGTLRCIQAIIKMQDLVRAHQTGRLVEGSSDFGKQSECNEKSKKEAKCNGSYTYASIEKLLSNGFARQLTESPSTTKPINIKCHPSKSDSAWKWLERWTLVSSVTIEEPQNSAILAEQKHKEDSEHPNGEIDFHSDVHVSPELSENDDDAISNDASPMPPPSNPHTTDGLSSTYEVTESVTTETKEADLIEMMNPKSLPKELHEQDGPDSQKISSEQPESEAEKKMEVKSFPEELHEQDGTDSKLIYFEQPSTEAKPMEGKSLPKELHEQDESERPEVKAKMFSKKESNNPAFIAAKSKFEELSSCSSAPTAKSTGSSVPNRRVESGMDEVSSSTEQFRSAKFELADSAISNSAAQIGGSECGTELSITSTFDSPEKSDAEEDDCIEQVTKRENLGEANEKSMVLETDPSFTNSDHFERNESANSATGESLYASIAVDSSLEPEKKPEAITSDMQLISEASNNPVNSAPQASPRNHVTVTESQETTPSSKVSNKRKKNKVEKTESSPKVKSAASTNRKSLPNRNQESVSRGNSDGLQEHKTGKRNSLVSAKSDQEPRDNSSSSNSLPSYMQATQSAKAKAITSGSPRSSPDVHDKDIHIKKKQSLISSNEKQTSPNIRRTLSLAQPNEKGNAVHSPQERKWKR